MLEQRTRKRFDPRPVLKLVQDDLDRRGYAVIPALLDPEQCAELRARFDDDAFRNTVVMERHGYGRGVYRYFAYPLPRLVAELRERVYAQLAPSRTRGPRRSASLRATPRSSRIFSSAATPPGRRGRRR
jgi:hypothetical protein